MNKSRSNKYMLTPNSRYSYLLKNTGILTIANFATKLLTFFLVPIYTSVLSIQEYGTYDLVVSTVSLLYPVLCFNVTDGVMRFLMDKNGQEKQIFSIGMKFSLISCLAAILIMLLISRLNFFPGIRGLEIYIIFYYICLTLVQLFIQFAKGLERVSDMALAGVLGVIVIIVENLIFLLVFHLGLKGLFLASILAQTVEIVYYALRLKIWKYFTSEKIDKRLQKKMLIFSVPLITTALSWTINSSADKYIVAIALGAEADGLLAVAYKIPNILNVFQSIFTQAWQISGMKEYGTEGADVFYGRIFSMTNVLMCLACSCLILLTRPLASFLYAEDFYAAWQYVPFLLITNVLNCASGILGPILSAKKDSKGMAVSAICGVLTNIIMNITLVYFMGIQGVTIATVISSAVIYIMRRKCIGKDIKEQYPMRSILTWMLLCVQAAIAIFLQQTWLEIAVMTIIVAINIPMFKKVMKTVSRMISYQMK